MHKFQIHQFSPSAVYGDGITNGMFYFQKILKELGFKSNIYVQNIKSDFGDKVLSYKTFDTNNENQIIFIHYSIYYDFSHWIDKLTIKKHIIYHNITPPNFFEGNPFLQEMCAKGIETLPSLATKFEGSIGDSELNSQELRQHGFKNIHTIPLLLDTHAFLDTPMNKQLFESLIENFTIIFVGRIAKNKAQHDLIQIANIYRYISQDFKLYIIGGATDLQYEQELKQSIKEYGLEENVLLTSKVSNEDLVAYYKAANIFLCMSEHEGFGIPLIEAMLTNTPVLAYNSSNIPNTLNGGGVLFSEKSHKHIAATIHLIRQNPKLRYEIIQTQHTALTLYEHENIVHQVINYLKLFSLDANHVVQAKPKSPSYQFEGSFDTSYSLAILNKNAALTFEKIFPNEVSLYSLEGYGDFEPNALFLQNHPEIAKLHSRGTKPALGEATFRNIYPPKVAGMKSKLNILNSYGWEESAFEKEHVQAFNEILNGIIAVSNFVRNVLINNGVTTPICVISNPIDHITSIKPTPIKLKSAKSFRFLHISSAFPRKGVDILLQAYFEAFTQKDDVVLIIKTFPNPHNTIEKDLKELQKAYPNHPEVELINKDLEDGCIPWLYQNTHALVAPSFGEGFGLPMAEAMFFDLPVITTNYSGQTDFCTHETAWLIDYAFEPSKSHLKLFNSYWAKPSTSHLAFLLKEQTTLTQKQKLQKTKKAKQFVNENFTWQNYATKTLAFLETLKAQKPFQTQKANLAWVSTYNTKCGIATYSEFLLSNIDKTKFNITIYANTADDILYEEDQTHIKRCWNNRFDKDNQPLIDQILKDKITHVLINFNFAFFSTKNLANILNTFKKHNIKTTIIFHSVEDVIIKDLEASLSDCSAALQNAHKLLVHNIKDLNTLKSFGLTKNISFFPHGVQERIHQTKPKEEKEIFTISSFGFMLPHKGILELIEAFYLLSVKHKHIKLKLINALYPDEISKRYADQAKTLITKYGLDSRVIMINDFLTDEEIFSRLSSANLLVMPYGQTQESASGAIRYALSLMKPVLCTPIAIFNDVSSMVHFTKDNSIESLANSIDDFINQKTNSVDKMNIQRKWVKQHSWKSVIKLLQNHILCEV